jgi:hypothetical protein
MDTKKPTPDDVSIPPQPPTALYVSAATGLALLVLGYLCYLHFYVGTPGILSIPTGPGLTTGLLYIGIAVVVVYGAFFLIGFVESIAAGYFKCKKYDMSKSAVQAAYFALNPAIAYLIIRTLTVLRKHYDRIMVSVGIKTGIWSIGAFMSTWVLFQTILLFDESARQICVPSGDEATAFKNEVLASEKARSDKLHSPPGQ